MHYLCNKQPLIFAPLNASSLLLLMGCVVIRNNSQTPIEFDAETASYTNDAGQWELTDGNDTIVNFTRAEDTLFFSDETQKTGITPITMVTGFAGDEDAPIIKAQFETSAGKKYISQLTFTFALNDGVTTVNFGATNRYEVTDESLFDADSTLTDYTMLQTIFGGADYFCMKDYDELQTSLDVI